MKTFQQYSYDERKRATDNTTKLITNENDREIFSQQVGKADFNVIDFAEALGIKVIESKLPAKVGGYIVVKENQ